MTQKNYPQYYEHMKEIVGDLGHEIPKTLAGFSRLHDAALADGALSRSIKELMAVAIGIASGCDGCIASHINDALKAGATHDEVVETIGVAVLMGGGPSLMHGAEALEALNQFEEAMTMEAAD